MKGKWEINNTGRHRDTNIRNTVLKLIEMMFDSDL